LTGEVSLLRGHDAGQLSSIDGQEASGLSLAMEGKFSGEGLQTIDEHDDLLMAMARELVNQESIGESPDAVWRNLRRQWQQEQLSPSKGRAPDELPAASPADRFREGTMAEETYP